MKSDLSIRSAIYLRAAEIIEEKGLCKDGHASDGGGRLCAIIAFLDAAEEFGERNGDVSIEMVRQETDGYEWPIWVTLPHVTAEMVAARFRELA